MLNKKNSSKKAQVGETVTWVVATILIVVILMISIFVTSSIPRGSKGNLVFGDKQKDLLATISIVNFLEKHEELIKTASVTEDFTEVEQVFKPFLSEIPVSGDIKGWNMEVGNNCEKNCKISTREIIVGKWRCYDLTFFVDDTRLNFWTDFQGGC